MTSATAAIWGRTNGQVGVDRGHKQGEGWHPRHILHPGNFRDVFGKFLDTSRNLLRYVPEVSGKCPGHFLEMSRKCPGNVLELSRTFPGHVPDISRTGKLPDLSRTFPRHFHELSWLWPEKFLDI